MNIPKPEYLAGQIVLYNYRWATYVGGNEKIPCVGMMKIHRAEYSNDRWLYSDSSEHIFITEDCVYNAVVGDHWICPHNTQ